LGFVQKNGSYVKEKETKNSPNEKILRSDGCFIVFRLLGGESEDPFQVL